MPAGGYAKRPDVPPAPRGARGSGPLRTGKQPRKQDGNLLLDGLEVGATLEHSGLDQAQAGEAEEQRDRHGADDRPPVAGGRRQTEAEEAPPATSSLAGASEEELVRELARRRAERFRLAGAMGRINGDDEPDPTGQVCSLNGGNGTIPCRELME